MTDQIEVHLDETVRPVWDRVQEKAFLLLGPPPPGVSEHQIALIFLLSTFQRVFPAATGDCRHCGRPVAYRAIMDGHCHLRPEARSLTWGWSDVGCYAASFDWLDGTWDPDLDLKLKASPLPDLPAPSG